MKRTTSCILLLCAFSLAGFSHLHAAAGPDLIITDVWVDGTRVHYQIQNIGVLTCSGQHETSLLLDGQFYSKDVITETIVTGERLNRSFSKGEFECTGSAHSLNVIADGDKDIGELNESNNGREEIYVCDQVAPKITQGPTVTELKPGSFMITWKTDENADSAVLYGQTTGKLTTASDSSRSQDHVIYLDKMATGAVYCYQVRSVDQSGNEVQSGLRYFTTAPPDDPTAPTVATPKKLQTDQPLFPLRFEVAAQDNTEVDRVDFSYDGTRFMTDYDPPFGCYLLPDDLGITHRTYFGLDHTILAEVYDLSDNLRAATVAWGERPRCEEMELEIELGGSTRYYTPEETVYGYSGEIQILARKNAGLILIPGEGPHPGITGTRWEEVDQVRVYYDDSLIETIVPAADETELTSPLVIATLTAPSTHEIKVEIQTGACTKVRRATMEVIRQVTDVTAERTVTRNGTAFEVAITFVNDGTATAILDYLVEEAEGFQITVPESSLYDATVTYNPTTRRSAIEYDFNCWIDSGSSRIFRYTAIPILSEGVSGYLLGESNASRYHDAFGHRFDGNTLPEVSRIEGQLLEDAVNEACEESDYLIVTNPAALFGIHDPAAVNRLLAKTAELADVRNAILGYYLGAGSVRTAFHSNDKIALGNVLGDWKDEIVILDESDDVIRIYSPSRQHVIGSGNDRDLPIPVSGLHPDDVLLVGNLLHDDDPSHPEDEIAVVDGHSAGGARGDVVLFDYRPDHNDFDEDTNDTTYDPAGGDQIIVGDMIYQTAATWVSDEIILFDGGSGEVMAYYGNAPIHRRWDSVYEPGDLVAAGDLISSIDGDEIVIGDVSAQRIYIYSGDGVIQHQYDAAIEESDRLQVSHEGLALADNSDDRVSIREIYVGLDAELGSFNVNVHSNDAFLIGQVIEHSSPQYLFARGHREDHFTHGDVEIYPYSGFAGGEPGDRQQLDSLLSPGGEWAEKMGSNFIDNGYLLIVGETEIIPAFSCSYYLAGYGRNYVEFTDNYYSNTSGEMKKPEIAAGRIIGNTIDHIMIPIQTSLDVARGDTELNLAEAYCFSGGPEERHETARHTVVEALEDKGWHVTRNDEPTAATVYSHTANIDALYMAGHGNWDHCWEVDRGNVESSFDPGRTAPIVFAASCLTGEYPADESTLGEHFLEKGASAYIGATEISYSPWNRYLSEGFFDRLEFDSPIGAALKGAKRARMGDGKYGKYQSAIYHFYGDPKLEAISAAAMTGDKAAGQIQSGFEEQAIKGPIGTVNISIRDFTVAQTRDGDVASIPGGTVLAEPGRPEVPAWPVDIRFPKGYIVQKVALTPVEATRGTGLDLVEVQPDTDDETHTGPALGDSDAWPDRQYDWSTEANPDGSTTLTVWIYPLRTWPESTNYTYFNKCTLNIGYSSTSMVINRLRVDPRICSIGNPLTIEAFIYNTSLKATNVIAEAQLVQNGSAADPIGLPIKYLRDIPKLASFSWTAETDQIPPDIYDIHVRLKTLDNQLLAEKSTAVQIGATDGKTHPLKTVPPTFAVGQDVTVHAAFENTGQAPLTPRIVLEIQRPDGTLIKRFEDTGADLPPGGVFKPHWDWKPTVASSDCRYMVYTLFDGKRTPIVIGMFGSIYYVMENMEDCPSGEKCFPFIQEAIDAVPGEGYLVVIMPGDYPENVVVNKPTTLIVLDGKVCVGPCSK